MQKPSLTMTRRIKATPAAVFEAFTNPDKLVLWFGRGAPSDKIAQMDPRVGGAFHWGFPGDGAERNDVMGVFKEVRAPERLVFTWAWKSTPERESLVTIDIAPDGEATLLTILHEAFHDEAACDAHGAGWTYGLNQLQALVEKEAVAA
jgi:uncharacterized protein YndB with AHSA1/START domain